MAETQIQLTPCTKDGLAALEDAFQDALEQNDSQKVRELLELADQELHDTCVNLGDTNPEHAAQVQAVLQRAKWGIVRFLTPQELGELCVANPAGVLTLPAESMQDDIDMVLTTAVSDEQEQEIRQQMRKALSDAQFTIGSQQIQFNNTAVEPTLQNWIRDWRNFLQDLDPNELRIVEYINNQDNPRQLDTPDQEMLERVLRLYYKLESFEPRTLRPAQYLVADPVAGVYRQFVNGVESDVQLPIEADELEQLRFEAKLDHEGQPLTAQEQILTDPNLTDAAWENYQTIIARKQAGEPTIQAAGVYAKPNQTAEAPVEAPAQVAPAPIEEPVIPAEAEPTPEPVVTPPTPLPTPPPVAAAPEPVVVEQPTEDVPEPSGAYMAAAQQVLNQHKLLLESSSAERRFLSVLGSFLRGVRSETELRDALTRPVDAGGVNLPVSQVDAVIDTAKDLLNGGINTVKPVVTAAPPVNLPTFAQVAEHIQKGAAAQPTIEAAQAANPIDDIFGETDLQLDEEIANMSVPNPQKPAAPDDTISSIAATASDAPGGVVGPIDELQAVTPVEFRRFSEDPKEAAQRIIEKINLFEADSIAKKAEAIQAWQQSPLNQLYVRIGSTSLEQSQPVETVLQAMQAAGEDTLTADEFYAIADLNRHLRF